MNAPTLKMVATTFAPLNEVGEIDPKLAWLARAAARFELVEADQSLSSNWKSLGKIVRRLAIGGIDAPR
jgi:hypothetical protein